MSVLKKSFPVVLLVSCPVIYGAPAVDQKLSLGVYNEWSDNVEAVADGGSSDMITNIYAQIKVAGKIRQVNYGIGYTVQNESYQKDSFGDRNYLNGSANLDWDIIPKKLFWNNSIVSRTTLRSSNSPDLPDNRDQRNTFVSQPGFILHPSNRDTVLVTASVSKVDFREDGGNNSDRLGSAIDWGHKFTTLTSGGVECNYESADFDQQVGYKSYDCQLNAVRLINNGKLEASFGQKVLNPDQGEDLDGSVYTIRGEWSKGAHSFYFVSTRDLTDSSVGFTRINFVDSVVKPVDIDTSDAKLVERTRTVVGLGEIFSPTFGISAFLFRDSEDVYASNDDTLREGLVVTFDKKLNWNYGTKADFQIENTTLQQGSPEEFDESYKEIRLELYKELTEELRVAGGVRVENQTADAATSEFEINTLYLDLRYTF